MSKQLLFGEWNSIEESVKIFLPEEVNATNAIFFDLDGTLVTSRSGTEVYNITNPNDFIFLPDVVNKLIALSSSFTIVIYCSYSLSEEEQHTSKVLFSRVRSIQKVLNAYGVNPFIFIPTKRDKYKVPNKGIYTLFEKILESIYSTNVSDTIVVGDGIGKNEKNPIYKITDVDCKFAENIGCKILRPHEIFDFTYSFTPAHGEVIIMMGNPCCGKSTFAQKLCDSFDYSIVDLQSLKKYGNKAASSGRSFVIDDAHPTSTERRRIVSLAGSMGMKCRIFFIITDGRCFNLQLPQSSKKLKGEFDSYSKKFQMPFEDVDGCEVVVLVG